MRRVYLDNQSATPLLPAALEAMRPFFSEEFGNPASPNQLGLRAREALAEARAQTAALIGAESPEDIIFTSDGTESSNLAVMGAAWAAERQGNHLIVGATEHPAVLRSVEFLEQRGFTATRVKVDGRGMVDPADVRRAMTERTILVAVHLANHDIGAIEPAREIGAIAAERGVIFYVDADAAAGWMPIDVRELGAGLLSFSPHRFYGPKGVGALYRHRRARLAGILRGGDQENGRRAGVENVPAIVGAGVAAEAARRELGQRAELVGKLQRRLWEGIRANVADARLNGPEPGPGRAPNNLNVSFAGIEGEGLALLADVNGVAFNAGAACVSKALKISPTLAAIGASPEMARGSVIFSIGKDNTEEEIDGVVAALPKWVGKLRSLGP